MIYCFDKNLKQQYKITKFYTTMLKYEMEKSE